MRYSIGSNCGRDCGTFGVIKSVVDDRSVVEFYLARIFVEVGESVLAPMFLDRPALLRIKKKQQMNGKCHSSSNRSNPCRESEVFVKTYLSLNGFGIIKFVGTEGVIFTCVRSSALGTLLMEGIEVIVFNNNKIRNTNDKRSICKSLASKYSSTYRGGDDFLHRNTQQVLKLQGLNQVGVPNETAIRHFHILNHLVNLGHLLHTLVVVKRREN